MKTQKRVQSGTQRIAAVKESKADVKIRRRRRVLRAVAGAVVGGVVAGPIGAGAGLVVGAARRHAPLLEGGEASEPRRARGKTKRTLDSKPAETGNRPAPAPKVGKRSVRRKKPLVHIYPPIP